MRMSKAAYRKGSLADLVILNDSILKVDPQNIKELKVESTIPNEEILYIGNH